MNIDMGGERWSNKKSLYQHLVEQAAKWRTVEFKPKKEDDDCTWYPINRDLSSHLFNGSLDWNNRDYRVKQPWIKEEEWKGGATGHIVIK